MYLNIHYRDVNLEVAARISATDYFKEHFEALYDAEGGVRIDVLCLGRYEPWQTQRFFRKWCGNARPHPMVKNPGFSDFVMLAECSVWRAFIVARTPRRRIPPACRRAECSVWRAFIVAETSMEANGRDIEKAVSRAAWLRECPALNGKVLFRNPLHHCVGLGKERGAGYRYLAGSGEPGRSMPERAL